MAMSNVRSKWSGGDLQFYQSTAANSAGIRYGGASDNFVLEFYGTTFVATSTAVSGTNDGTHGYLTIDVNGTTRYIKLYDSVS